MNSFRKTLKELRLAQEQKARVRRATDEELGLTDGFHAFDDFRGQMVERIETLMSEFLREAPGFALHHGFYEGRYAVTLSADLPTSPSAGTGREFSRITFLLSPSNEDMILEVGVKMTVRNRDLVSHQASARLPHEPGMESLRSFVEEEMLRFAAAWFRVRQPEAVQA